MKQEIKIARYKTQPPHLQGIIVKSSQYNIFGTSKIYTRNCLYINVFQHGQSFHTLVQISVSSVTLSLSAAGLQRNVHTCTQPVQYFRPTQNKFGNYCSFTLRSSSLRILKQTRIISNRLCANETQKSASARINQQFTFRNLTSLSVK